MKRIIKSLCLTIMFGFSPIGAKAQTSVRERLRIIEEQKQEQQRKEEESKNPFIKYDWYSSFYGDVAIAKISNLDEWGQTESYSYGLIDTKANRVTEEFCYESLSAITIDGEVFFKGTYDGKIGILNSTGDVVVPFYYSYIGMPKNGYADVRLGDKCGRINLNTGTYVIDCVYDRLTDRSDGTIYAMKDRKYGLLSSKGEVIIPCLYSYLGEFYNNIAWIQRNGRYGVVGVDGKIIIECEYIKYYECNNGNKGNLISCSGAVKLSDFMYVTDGIKWGIINDHGKVVLPVIYSGISPFYKNVAWGKVETSFAMIKKTDDSFIPDSVRYESISYLSQDMAVKDFQFVDIDVNINMPPLFFVKHNNRYGIVNEDGNTLISCKYDSLGDMLYDDRLLVSCNGLYGFVDSKGNEVIKPIHNYASRFSEGLAAIRLPEQEGFAFINSHGDLVIDFKKYDKVDNFVGGRCRVYKEDKFWYIDTNGKKTKMTDIDKLEAKKYKDQYKASEKMSR